MRPVLYALAAATCGCSPFGGGAFTCTDDLQCTGGGAAGTCQPTGFCSFADDSCPSGQRYGDSSGGLGGVCVDDEPPVDDCVIGGLDLCDETPLSPIQITVQETIDTDTDPRCITFAQTGGGDACLVYSTQVSISAGATVSAIGSRPLIIASAASMTLGGDLDVSSRRAGPIGAGANHSACTTEREAESDGGGAAGAGGGSFRGKGGDGGDGDTDDSIGGDGNAQKGEASDPLATAPAFARGGCGGAKGGDELAGPPPRGTGGAGGASGGAVWLVANDTIEVSGAIRAMGAGGAGGGDQAGGGGGGSGGFIKLAATTLTISGSLSANGGGGGEGGCNCSGIETPGNPGADGLTGTAAAGGGTGASGPGGDGGSSGATAPLDALPGMPSVVGSGGGGGGAGFIVLVGTATVTGTVSPPPQ